MASDKLIRSMSKYSMVIVFAAMVAYMLQQLLSPQLQQAQSERYGVWFFGPAGYNMNVENGPDEQPTYMGEAAPGTLNSEAGWRIYKYTYVFDPATGDMLSGTLRYANGSTSFDKIWDNRADYEYI